MTPMEVLPYAMSFGLGGVIGAGWTLINLARDRSIVRLKPGQVLTEQAVLDALAARVEAIENGPLKYSVRATAKRRNPEEDYGDGEEDEA